METSRRDMSGDGNGTTVSDDHDVMTSTGGITTVDSDDHDVVASTGVIATVESASVSTKETDPFHVVTDLIPQAALDDQASAELLGLGLNVFNQAEFEQGVIAQVDKAMAIEEEQRLKKILEKEIKSVDESYSTTKKELEHINKVLTSLPIAASGFGEGKRKLDAVQRQKDNKLKQLKKLKARRKFLQMKIYGALADDEDENEDADSTEFNSNLLFLSTNKSNKESEKDRMIRLGEMTPFGTVIKSKETSKSPQPSTSQVSDFEKFMSEQDSTSPTKLVKRNSQTLSKHSVKRRVSEPGLNTTAVGDASHESHSKKVKQRVTNFFDERDRKLYDRERDDTEKLKPRVTNLFDERDRKLYDRERDDTEKLKPRVTNLFDERDRKLYDRERDYTEKRYQQKAHHKIHHSFTEDGDVSGSELVCSDDDERVGNDDDDDQRVGSDDEYIPDKHEWNAEYDSDEVQGVAKKPGKKRAAQTDNEPPPYTYNDYVPARKKKKKSDLSVKKTKDDGDEKFYEKRMKQHHKDELLRKFESQQEGEEEEDEQFEGGLKVPGHVWSKLYKYQKTGVRWLWELHSQESGGIVGDEMGLGKTIQMIVFFAALKYSKLRCKHLPFVGLGPCIIVCPTTVMHQWVKEFHKWWPSVRVAILHSSGSHSGKESELVQTIVKSHGVLVTSFNTLVLQQETVLRYRWHYVVLDEGHKIRNPDAQITLACKQFRTPHRIILSGSPIQNNLKELWSLFDFIFPGKLGTLPDFLEHFSVPIVQGGYANATQVQVETSYRCVCVLRDTINPYLLRRMKEDVKSNINLPDKSEQVLFCRLTDEQQDVYQDYLDSRECQSILAGKYKLFAGLITLRKICNHPDLSTGGPRIFVGQSTDGDETLEYGYWRRSGKLIVVEALLRLWKKQKHRILLFSQSRMMLDILESFVIKQGYKYLKMDGTTPISARQPLVTKFNSDSTLDVFLLTTRVGGLGVNLTGADRVIIFDPDWNPSTDMQARERAWRIGQTRQVTIYRLLTSGTIEEKIYHRQIFKQFLTNRVLKDPKQRRFFKANDIFELFTLNNKGDGEGTETSAIFAGTGSEVKVPKKNKINRFDEIKRMKNCKTSDDFEKKRMKNCKTSDDFEKKRMKHCKTSDEFEAGIDTEELTRMRELAKKLSKQIGEGKVSCSNHTGNSTAKSAFVKPSYTGNSTAESGFASNHTGNSTAESGFSSNHTGNSTAESGFASNHTGNSTAESGFSSNHTGNSTAESGFSSNHTGNSTAESGFSSNHTGNSTAESVFSSNHTGNSTAESGFASNHTGNSTAESGFASNHTGSTAESGFASNHPGNSTAESGFASNHPGNSTAESGFASNHTGNSTAESGFVKSSTNPVCLASNHTAESGFASNHTRYSTAESGFVKSSTNPVCLASKHTAESGSVKSSSNSVHIATDRTASHMTGIKTPNNLVAEWQKVDNFKQRKSLSVHKNHKIDMKGEKKKKKKKRHKDAKFEGERIPYLDRHKAHESKTAKSGDTGDNSMQQDDYVLRALFKETGIQGALQHDKIMDSSRPDYALVEAEAEKVARQAAIALKKSRSECFPAVSGIPTWTGQHGGPAARLRFGKKKNNLLVGQPVKAETVTSSSVEEKVAKQKLFDGSTSGSVAVSFSLMSSDELLSKMRNRHRMSTSQQEGDGDPLDLINCDHMELMTDIRNFVAFQAANDGRATTQELIEHFKPKIPKDGSARFKAMLKQICDLDKINGSGMWRLKYEFR